MPTVNMEVLEKSRRHQVVQKYEIYPLNTSDIENYQINTIGMTSSVEEDARIIQDASQLAQWAESKGDVWSKIVNLKAKTPQVILGLSGDPSSKDIDDGDTVFEFFDEDFKDFIKTDYSVKEHDVTYPYTSGSYVIRTSNGRLLNMYQKATTNSQKYYSIYGIFSDDNGLTWGNDFLFQAGNPGTWGAMTVGFIVNDLNEIYGFYMKWTSSSDCKIYYKVSTDNGSSWSSSTLLSTSYGYTTAAGNGYTMQDGTMILPLIGGNSPFTTFVMRSEDNGTNWIQGNDVPSSGIGSNGELEGTVIELSNNTLYMLMRNNGGYLLKSTSTNKGASWTTPVSSGIVSSDAPASLFLLSWNTHKVLLVWDEHSSNRYPLHIAMSTDDCVTFINTKLIANPSNDVAYPSIAQSEDEHIIVNYWNNEGTTHDVKGSRFIEGWLNPLVSKWDGDTGDVSVSNGIANLSGNEKYLHGKTNQSLPFISEILSKVLDDEVTDAFIGIGDIISVSTYEDFTTYTEVDTVNDRIQKTANHIDFVSSRNAEETYLYKDYGVNYFGNFTHHVDAKIESGTWVGYVWGLSNTVDEIFDCDPAVGVRFYGGSVDHIYMVEYSGIEYSDVSSLSLVDGTWYYLVIEKNGTALTCKIYSDLARTNLLETLQLTLHADHQFRYVYGASSHTLTSVQLVTLDIENLCLTGSSCIVDVAPQNGTLYRTVTGIDKIFTRTSSSWNDKSTINANLDSYQIRKFVMTSTNVKVYYNDTLDKEILINIPITDMNAWFNSVTGGNVLVDWIFIRKHTVNEPIIQKINRLNRALLIKVLGSRL